MSPSAGLVTALTSNRLPVTTKTFGCENDSDRGIAGVGVNLVPIAQFSHQPTSEPAALVVLDQELTDLAMDPAAVTAIGVARS
jgi:hypothetical protein